MDIRVGLGFDTHRLEAGRPLILGGVPIVSERGCVGHSDADVLIHALCDALLGAANLRDIGCHFPDTDPKYKGVDSRVLLRECCRMVREKAWEIANTDTVLVIQEPKINPYLPEMQAQLAAVMGIAEDAVSIKVKTSERLGFIGRCEGVSAQAVVLLTK